MSGKANADPKIDTEYIVYPSWINYMIAFHFCFLRGVPYLLVLGKRACFNEVQRTFNKAGQSSGREATTSNAVSFVQAPPVEEQLELVCPNPSYLSLYADVSKYDMGTVVTVVQRMEVS